MITNDKALKKAIAALFVMEQRRTYETYGFDVRELNETRDRLENLRQTLKGKEARDDVRPLRGP